MNASWVIVEKTAGHAQQAKEQPPLDVTSTSSAVAACTEEKPLIDVDVYFDISDLFRFRYDPAVLGLIAERPHRFRELVSRLESHVDGHVDDNAVGRSLKRLAKVNHVFKARARYGDRLVPVYTITDEGRLHLRVYDAFIDAYRRIQLDNDAA